jgi:hypothetical protein
MKRPQKLIVRTRSESPWLLAFPLPRAGEGQG